MCYKLDSIVDRLLNLPVNKPGGFSFGRNGSVAQRQAQGALLENCWWHRFCRQILLKEARRRRPIVPRPGVSRSCTCMANEWASWLLGFRRWDWQIIQDEASLSDN